MIPLHLPVPDGRPLRLLCLGAHSDDLEIGAGATLLTLGERHQDLEVTWVVLSAPDQRADEARRGAGLFAPAAKLEIHDFPDGRFPMALGDIKDVIADVARRVSPDLILAPSEHDRHQDHEAVNRLTWQCFRDHTVLEYEIPKFDGDLVTPNVYFEISPEMAERKMAHLREAFVSQTSKPWFDEAAFMGLLRIRGIECRSATGLAEGFHMRKATLK